MFVPVAGSSEGGYEELDRVARAAALEVARLGRVLSTWLLSSEVGLESEAESV